MGMVTMYLGVVSRCCCKEVRYIDILTIIINFPYILHCTFFSASLLLCSFLNVFPSCFP